MIQINTLMEKKKKDSQTENRLVVVKREDRRGGEDWELRISGCKLLYIGWVNHKILLYSTGNYIHYSVTNHSGKEYANIYIYVCVCMCIKLSHCCAE